MDRIAGRARVRATAPDRRAFPRTKVLWSALIATSDGQSAFDSIIRNINEGGAEVTSKRPLKLGDQVYLLLSRSQIAYLASVVWAEADRMGLSFDRHWEMASGLPPELGFLRQRLAEAKLSQMLALVAHGMPLAEAAATVGWTESEIEQLGDAFATDRNTSPVLIRTRALFAR